MLFKSIFSRQMPRRLGNLERDWPTGSPVTHAQSFLSSVFVMTCYYVIDEKIVFSICVLYFTTSHRSRPQAFFGSARKVGLSNVCAYAKSHGLRMAPTARPIPIVLGNFWRLEQLFAVLATSSKFCLSEQFLSKILV